MSKSGKQTDDICNLIRAEFKRSGMSILAFAKRSDVRYASAHNCLVGGASVRTLTASKMCRVLGLELRVVRKRKGE